MQGLEFPLAPTLTRWSAAALSHPDSPDAARSALPDVLAETDRRARGRRARGLHRGALGPDGWVARGRARGRRCEHCAGGHGRATGVRFDSRENVGPLAARSPLAGIRLVLRMPALRRLARSSTTFAATQLSLATFLVTFLTERAHVPLVTAGIVMAVAQGSGIVGRTLLGWVADRLLRAGRVWRCSVSGWARRLSRRV